jgi:septum formation protein
MVKPTFSLVLGSASPRRRELLSALGYDFTLLVKDTDESFDPIMPAANVPTFLAEKKAEAVLPFIDEQSAVLCADTVVILDQQILGKPSSPEEAAEMLERLSGKQHKVVTGICLQSHYGKFVQSDETIVHFKEIPSKAINYYIAHYKPYDKAGSYGIQEWIGHHFVERIEGSFSTVMGLPTHCIAPLIEKMEQKKRES